MSATSRQFTLVPLPPAQLVAGKAQAELARLDLPQPRPTPAILTSNPALAQARVVEGVFTAEECEAIIAIGAKRPREDARVQSYGNAARIGHVAWVDPGPDTIWISCDSLQVKRLPQSSNVLPNCTVPVTVSKDSSTGLNRKSRPVMSIPMALGRSPRRILPPLSAVAP